MVYSGCIGFATTVEQAQSVYTESIVERRVRGYVVRNTRKLQNTSNTNSDVDIYNEFEITGNSFLRENIASMRYITWRGVKWKITSADASTYPKIVLQVGGVYNENTY